MFRTGHASCYGWEDPDSLALKRSDPLSRAGNHARPQHAEVPLSGRGRSGIRCRAASSTKCSPISHAKTAKKSNGSRARRGTGQCGQRQRPPSVPSCAEICDGPRRRDQIQRVTGRADSRRDFFTTPRKSCSICCRRSVCGCPRTTSIRQNDSPLLHPSSALERTCPGGCLGGNSVLNSCSASTCSRNQRALLRSVSLVPAMR